MSPGVLAAVTSGIYAGWNAHRAMDAGTRLSGIAFWRVMTFGLEALLFVLLGLQAPQLAEELDVGELALQALAVAGTVIAVRMLWTAIPFGEIGSNARERIAVGWAGMRGAISLAAALAVPIEVAGAPGDPAADVRRDRRHADRPGADAGAAAAAPGPAGREPVLARRGDRAAGGRAGRARPARRARGGGRRRGAAAPPARALPRALRGLRRGARRRTSCPRTVAGSCASTARCGAS